MSSSNEKPKISMAASAIALRGVQIFLNASKAAAERKDTSPTISKKVQIKKKKMAEGIKLPQRTLELLHRTTKFYKNELEDLYTMYRSLLSAANTTGPNSSAFGQTPAPKAEGIDQTTFRDLMHNTLDLVTEEAILDRMWITWDRGAAGGEGALKFEAWVKGLNVLIKGTDQERQLHCFQVYDLNSDGYITKDEMFILLKNSLLKQPGDEDPEEGVRDLVELALKKLDVDKDGKISLEDYREAVKQEPLLLEAFGQCLPSKRHAEAFLKSLCHKP